MEKLDDVLGYGLKIYQRREWFSFSLDSVLLANFASLKLTTKTILDLGCGNGIIPLILSQRTKANIVGVEIQGDLVDLANKSINYNNLSQQINILNCDINDLLDKKEKYNTFDLIVSNPPFFVNFDNSTKNDDIHKTIARHEVLINFDTITKVASRLLKEGGTFAIINRTVRLLEIFDIFKKYNIEPKRVKFIYKNENSSSNMVFIEGVKNGNQGMKVESPFFVYDLEGNNSIQYDEICRRVV